MLIFILNPDAMIASFFAFKNHKLFFLRGGNSVSVIQIWVFSILHSCLNMRLTGNYMSESSVSIIWLIDVFGVALFLFFFQNSSLSVRVSTLFFIKVSSLIFLLFLNLNNLVRQMLDRCSQNNIFIINKKFNIVQSLASLPVSGRTSSWLINANNGSLLVRNENDLIIVRELSWVLQNSSDMFSFFHLIHAFVIVYRNMGDIFNWWIIVISLSHSKIIIIFKFFIGISVILVFLSNLRKDVQFLFVMSVIWVDKHILIIWSNMIKLINFDVFVLTFI